MQRRQTGERSGAPRGRGWSPTRLVALSWLALAVPTAIQARQAPDAQAVVQRAAELMGGAERLRAVERVALDMTTVWLRTDFRDVPFTDRPSIEQHTDVRDYALNAWRNTRRFANGDIVNIIRDSVSITGRAGRFQPLSDAYVDERDELFIYTPDRLVLALLDAPALASLPDTVLGGEAHRHVAATFGDRGHVSEAEVFFQSGTGLPTMLRFSAGHPADFGLVQWGAMEVEVWYSGWTTFGDISIPRHWDIRRVGVGYKRLRVNRADFTPEFSADSFAIPDSLRSAYGTSAAARPMHEARLVENVRNPDEGVFLFEPPFGVPVGVATTSEGSVLLGAGRAPFNYDHAVEVLGHNGVAQPSFLLVARKMAGNGGVVRAAELGVPILASVASRPFVRRVLDNHGYGDVAIEVVDRTRSIGAGLTALEIEPIDLPDVPGAVMVYRASSGWLWVPDAAGPLHLRLARERAASLGWDVRMIGWQRQAWEPVDVP